MKDRAREPLQGARRLTRMNVGRVLLVALAVVLLAACTGSAASTEAPATTTPTALGSPTGSTPASLPATEPASSPSPTASATSTELASSPPAASPRATPSITPRASVSTPTPVPTPATLGVSGRVTAGPICPVARIPPDPNCADRPVEGAVLVVTDTAGHAVGRATSASNGDFSIALGPGSYVLVPQPVPGLMGTAGKVDFTLSSSRPSVTLDIQYDTGIR